MKDVPCCLMGHSMHGPLGLIAFSNGGVDKQNLKYTMYNICQQMLKVANAEL